MAYFVYYYIYEADVAKTERAFLRSVCNYNPEQTLPVQECLVNPPNRT